MTQLELALNNKSSELMEAVSKKEGVSVSFLKKGIASGIIVIPNNKKRRIKKPCAIGKGLSTKVNVNIGTSGDEIDVGDELQKLKAACLAGADTAMDLSVGGDIPKIRKILIKDSDIPFGTVPIYEAAQSSFFFNDTPPTKTSTLPLHDALPI